MKRRLSPVALALAFAFPAVAGAQMKFTPTPVIPGVIGLPPVPVTGAAMTLAPNVMTQATLAMPKTTLATPLTLVPAAGLSRAKPGAVAGAGAQTPAGAAVTMKGRLQQLASSVSPKPGAVSRNAGVSLQRFWTAGAQAAAEPDFMMFGGNLDPRIATSLQTLGHSAVGLSIYQNIHNKYGGSLQLRVDNNPSATYDARVSFEGSNPVITVTDNLLRRESAEFAGSFIAREMAQLYYGSFPASVERDYLAHSAMVRTYAEITGSNNNWWDRRRDRYQDGRYAMQSFFQSWREASNDYYARGRNIQDSPFFRYLQGNGGQTLEQQYYAGTITPGTYREMSDYFRQMGQAEYDWLRNSESRRNP